MDDHLPVAERIHHVDSRSRGAQADALSLTRTEGRWSQHLYSVLGRRRGQLVEVHVVQSFDLEQDTGPNGYLEDDEVIWRIEAVCFPLGDLPDESFSTIGDTLVIEGRYGFELTMDDMVWVIGESSAGSPLASAYLVPWREPKKPDAQIRVTVRQDQSDAAPSSPGWTETSDPQADATMGSRRWRRRTGDDLIEVDIHLAGDAPALQALPEAFLATFWIVA